jgi:hypothetical protein
MSLSDLQRVILYDPQLAAKIAEMMAPELAVCHFEKIGPSLCAYVLSWCLLNDTRLPLVCASWNHAAKAYQNVYWKWRIYNGFIRRSVPTFIIDEYDAFLGPVTYSLDDRLGWLFHTHRIYVNLQTYTIRMYSKTTTRVICCMCDDKGTYLQRILFCDCNNTRELVGSSFAMDYVKTRKDGLWTQSWGKHVDDGKDCLKFVTEHVSDAATISPGWLWSGGCVTGPYKYKRICQGEGVWTLPSGRKRKGFAVNGHPLYSNDDFVEFLRQQKQKIEQEENEAQ